MEELAPILRANAGPYAGVAMANIEREFPSDLRVLMTGPDDRPGRPRDRSPVFYGSYDWHSCVEMHWVLVRLLRVVPDAVPEAEVRALLDRQFTADALRGEADYVAGWHGTSQRPYGWGWVLALVSELATWDDADGRRWTERFEPLAAATVDRFLAWLPLATYPVRYGLHSNTAFGMGNALRYADPFAPELRDLLHLTARRMFGADRDYPGGWEPSGSDFLSPALVEAELMSRVLPRPEFGPWFSAFLPGLAAREPAALFEPAIVSDSSDGQTAHLHGLNASRAWCWRRIAEELPDGGPRAGVARDAMRRHLDAVLPHVVGDDYLVEHWLVAYAVLMLS